MNEERVWQTVQKARSNTRPTASKLLSFLVKDFVELHGDRYFGDDPSIIAGIGTLKDLPITIIAQEKGTTTPSKIQHHFGMPHPEGYRKALRIAALAAKFHQPIFFIIDTPGAYPGIGAEERGQAQAIAKNLFELIALPVPIVCLILGEGGSGGALALGIGDQVWMMEHAIYSILSPEGFASILYKDASLAKKVAVHMKITAQDLYDYHLIDLIIKENEQFESQPETVFSPLSEQLYTTFLSLQKLDISVLLEKRYQKYRKMGQ
ncbi:MAG: carboxyltransferase subunit alpha [Bacilli bacterium]|jgi:acetyl-CoA carboxylase carboxyl transferase subunit alpha|nr:carboxyltransferase subunit alpha [Bacilli bacterium]